MTKQTIEIDVPDGYELQYLGRNIFNSHMFAEVKKPPRRRIFECVSENRVWAKEGDLIEDDRGHIVGYGDFFAGKKYKIFKEIIEENN